MDRSKIRQKIELWITDIGYVFIALIISFFLIVVIDRMLRWAIVWRRNYTLRTLHGEERKTYAIRKIDENLARSLARSRLRLAPDPLQSEFVNVSHEGFRQDVPPNGSTDSFTIYIFGGSTTFGTGVADNETFPYYLQQQLNTLKLRRPVQVYNFGQPGYASYQEMYLLVDLLRQGKKPDIVVFYDVFNEESGLMDYLTEDRQSGYVETDYYWKPINKTLVTYRDHTFGVVDWLAKLKGFTHLAQYMRSKLISPRPRIQSNDDVVHIQRFAAGRVNTYIKNNEFVNAISPVWKLTPYFVLQPYKDSQNAQGLKAAYGRTLYQGITNSTHGRVLDWSRIFDKEKPSEIYLDSAHLTPKGNELLAEKLFDLLTHDAHVKALKQ